VSFYKNEIMIVLSCDNTNILTKEYVMKCNIGHAAKVMAFFICFILFLSEYTLGIGIPNQIHWSQYMSKHDIVCTRMPQDYYEGMYVGNGLLGTVMFRDNKKNDDIRFEIGRTDVYEHRPVDFCNTTHTWPAVRLPIGQLILSPKGKITATHLRIDLWNAELRGTISTAVGSMDILCYVPVQENVIVLNVKGYGGEKDVTVTFRPQQGNCTRAVLRPSANQVYIPNPPFRQSISADGIHTVVQPLLAGSDSKAHWNDLEWMKTQSAQVPLMGDDYATAWKDVVKNGTHHICLTVANRWAEKKKPGYGSADEAQKTIRNFIVRSEEQIIKAHRQWWHAYYPKSFVTVPDAKLESYYWIQLYRLASAGQPGKPVIDLMGPWYKPTVWPALWTNLNVQLTYCLWGETNHLDCENPFYQLLDRHPDELRNNVPADFRKDCSALGRVAGFDDLTGEVYLTRDTASTKEMSLIALPWSVQMYYSYYLRTMDESRLRNNIYPLMKRTFAVYQDILYKGKDGKYHLPLTFSDEYGSDHDTNMNLALARWGFETLIACAQHLHVDQDLVPVWQDLLKNMVAYQVDATGYRIGRDLSFDRAHRHFSHLFNIYPLHEIDIDRNPELLPLMRLSISHYADRTSPDKGENCMFKYAASALLWATIGEGEKALRCMERSMKIITDGSPTATPNGFYSETGWPTFESPIGTCRAMLEMMLQSHNGIIRVFPAMPNGWKDASFTDFRAEGRFSVSATRKNGNTAFVKISSMAGQPCVLKIDDLTDFGYKASSKDISVSKSGAYIRIDMRKGEDVILYAKGNNPSQWRITPLSRQAKDDNIWGVKE
jgi:alpha-L-fucosidase 2